MNVHRGITLALFLLSMLFSEFSVIARDKVPALTDSKRWSPSELFRGAVDEYWRNGHEVTVRFTVGSLRLVATPLPDGSERSEWHLIPSGALHSSKGFSIPLANEILLALQSRGVQDLRDYFTGKVVEIRGPISATSTPVSVSPLKRTYHIKVRSLMQILHVSPASGGDPRVA